MNVKKIILAILTIQLFSLSVFGQSNNKSANKYTTENISADNTDYKKTAQQLLRSAIEEKESAGIAAGFSVNGEIKWTGGEGFRNCKSKQPFLSTTQTRIASIAKPMTAVAIMQLYEQGIIDLDLPIQSYLPGFPSKSKGQITVKHLLQHASGIDAFASNKERQNKTHYANLVEAAKVFKDRDLLAEPGKAFNYTSYGYVVLGLIIEEVSQMSFEAYLQKNIWDILEMNQTGVEYFGKDYPNKSLLYHRKKKGKIKLAKPTDLSDRIPGGGIYSTVTDILKFGNALLNHQLIKEETFQMMMEDSGLKKEGNPYGMGFFLYGQNPKYGNVIGHTGGQTGVSAMFMLLPEVKTTTIVLSNTSRCMQKVSDIAIQLFDIAAESRKE